MHTRLAIGRNETEAPACGVRAIYRRFGLRRSRAGRTTSDVIRYERAWHEAPQRRSAPNQSGDESRALHNFEASRRLGLGRSDLHASFSEILSSRFAALCGQKSFLRFPAAIPDV